jgi:hypothetical protein
MRGNLARRSIALVTAYAVAFSALLPLAAVLLAPNAVGADFICSADPGRGNGSPAKPPPLCPCGSACALSGCSAGGCPGAVAHPHDPAVVFATGMAPLASTLAGGEDSPLRLAGRHFARAPPPA